MEPESGRKSIPGYMNKNAARDFVYIESREKAGHEDILDDFSQFLRNIQGKVSLPDDGALLNEAFSLHTPSGTTYYCFSYRGDLSAWSALVDSFAQSKRLGIARIVGELLKTGRGEVFDLSALRAVDHGELW